MKLLPLTATLGLALAALGPLATPARACGGFFCNAVTLSPIIQSGERVLFARTATGVTMHIEVQYAGDPTSFGWIVPVPERPKDSRGQPLPLEQAIQLSASEIFQQLQAQTNPTFSVRVGESLGDECQGASSGGCAPVPMAAGDAVHEERDQDDEGDPVVLDEAAVGPYQAQLLEAPDVDTLFDWLNRNGYNQDPAARPLLQHYVDLHYVFIGLRLQTGKRTGDIRPIAINLSETAPCVPLRLTKIAATDDMPILIWVLGQARAVPKNFLSAVVNDMALVYPGGQNYAQVVSAAVDTAAGHAWVTEMSGPTADLRGKFLPAGLDASSVSAAHSLSELDDRLSGLDSAPTARAIWRDELVPPPGFDALTFSLYPESVLLDPETTLVHDFPTVLARVVSELITPLAEVEDLLGATTTVTRFFTTSDAAEMTRDPVFAFNPDLPPVPRAHDIQARRGSAEDCTFKGAVEYSEGREITLGKNASGIQTIGPIAGEPPLLFVELLDESGPPLRFDPAQADAVDRQLDGATPGTASLPPTFETDPPPPLDHVKAPRKKADDGCTGSLPGAWMVLPVAGMFLLRRRARARAGA
ncbi:MAG: DUF2330 domain-containing protein [Myxococcota bacterium]